MTQNFILALILAIGSLMVQPAAAEGNLTIIVFDVDRAVAASKAGKSMAKQLERQTKAVRKKAEKIRKNLQADFAKIEKQKDVMAQDALRGKVTDLRKKELKKNEELQAEMAAIRAGGETAGQKILKIAEAELNDITKQRKADIVMRRGAVFYANPAIDVTDELIRRLNKKLTKVKVKPIKPKKKK